MGQWGGAVKLMHECAVVDRGALDLGTYCDTLCIYLLDLRTKHPARLRRGFPATPDHPSA